MPSNLVYYCLEALFVNIDSSATAKLSLLEIYTASDH